MDMKGGHISYISHYLNTRRSVKEGLRNTPSGIILTMACHAIQMYANKGVLPKDSCEYLPWLGMVSKCMQTKGSSQKILVKSCEYLSWLAMLTKCMQTKGCSQKIIVKSHEYLSWLAMHTKCMQTKGCSEKIPVNTYHGLAWYPNVCKQRGTPKKSF